MYTLTISLPNRDRLCYEKDNGIEWGQKKLADLDFADDLALLCHTQQELQDMTNRLHVFGKKLGYVSVARRRKL